MVVKKLVVPANWRLPLLAIVNLVAPDLEAVNKSPMPLLSTMKAAKDELAEAGSSRLSPGLGITADSKVSRGSRNSSD